MVRKIKYNDVAKAASLSVMPTRSISNLGAVVLVPTSIPTWHMMPRKDKRTMGLPKSLMQSMNEELLPPLISSLMGVAHSNSDAKTPTTK